VPFAALIQPTGVCHFRGHAPTCRRASRLPRTFSVVATVVADPLVVVNGLGPMLAPASGVWPRRPAVSVYCRGPA
jgi:hypothetical protein